MWRSFCEHVEIFLRRTCGDLSEENMWRSFRGFVVRILFNKITTESTSIHAVKIK